MRQDIRYLLAIVLLISLISFGCLEKKGPTASKPEQISNYQSFTLNGSNGYDYSVYTFSPVTDSASGLSIQRQVLVSVDTSANYTATAKNLSDLDLLSVDQILTDFSHASTQADSLCGQSTGLYQVICSDINTCAHLCASSSQRCNQLASSNSRVLGGSMIDYTNSYGDLKTLLLDSQRTVLKLQTSQDYDIFLSNIRAMAGKIAQINANPLFSSSQLNLCTHDDYGINYLNSAAAVFGNYSSSPSLYHYTVVLSVTPNQQNPSSAQIAGFSINDSIPKSFVPSPSGISYPHDSSSPSTIELLENSNSVIVSSSSDKLPPKTGYLEVYHFTSVQGPDSYVGTLSSPTFSYKIFNSLWLSPFIFTLSLVSSFISNYYLALGFSIGLTIIIILLVYNVCLFVIFFSSEKSSTARFATAIRRAFGKTDVRWKTDLIFAFVSLVAAFYVSNYWAIPPVLAPSIYSSLDFLLANGAGIVGVALSFLGIMEIYLLLENIIKLALVERAYGQAIRNERDSFIAMAATLKNKMAELNDEIEKLETQELDVTHEYEVLSSMRPERVDELVKTITPRGKILVEEQLNRVESSLNSLREKDRQAQTNWPKWSELITTTLSQDGQVAISSIKEIPPPLRNWAVSKYIKEKSREVGIEQGILRRKKLSAQTIVQNFLSRGLLYGVIVMKGGKPTLSNFIDGGGGTLTSVLSLKLISHVHSLSKSISQREAGSFVIICDKLAIAYVRGYSTESIVFANKDKFKDAMEQWKAALKSLEEG